MLTTQLGLLIKTPHSLYAEVQNTKIRSVNMAKHKRKT